MPSNIPSPTKPWRWALLAFALGCPMMAGAAVLAYDGFEDYSAGSNLNNGSLGDDWTGNWSTLDGHITVQSPDPALVDPNGSVSSGSQAARLQATADLPDVGSYMSRTFSAQTSTVYVAFLIRNVGGLGNDDFYNFQVSNGATGNTSSALGVGIRNQGGNPFFARVGSSSNATGNATTNATVGQNFLLVARFSKDGSSNYNRTDLYINPDSYIEPGTAAASATFGGTGIDTLSLFSVRSFQPESGDTVLIDELRIATTFEDALGGLPVPEPSLAMLLLIGGLGVVLRRRR